MSGAVGALGQASPPAGSGLLAPYSLGGVELRNRIYMPAMGTYFTDNEGRPTPLLTDFYVRRAKGGVGLIITEMHAVEPRGRSNGTQLGLWSDAQAHALRPMVDAIKAQGARVIAQISHAGRQTTSAVAGETPVAASAGVTCARYAESPRALGVDEIVDVVSRFGTTARLAVLAGYDGVEIHGAHGFLVAQFLSRFSNLRTDGYGGALSARMRFAQEVTASVRKGLGPDRALVVRLSLYEGVERGLVTAETGRIAAGLKEAGADAIDVSAGIVANRRLYCAPAAIERGHLLRAAREVRRVTDIPLLLPGRIVTAAQAEQVLADGDADMIGMARALLVDPDLPNKAAVGADTRHCIGCHQGCRSHPISCMINPAVGRDSAVFVRAVRRRRIVIVGAGPAGVECARMAASRGHDVILYEKTQQIGGQLLVGAAPPAKGDIFGYFDYQQRELDRLGVELRLGEAPAAGRIAADRPDHVVLATGSRTARRGLPGEELCLSVEAALRLETSPRRVVVIGGGESGVEAADYLAARGGQVLLVSSSVEIGHDMQPDPRFYLMQRLAASQVALRTGARAEAVSTSGVMMFDGVKRWSEPSDAVVLAAGVEPEETPAVDPSIASERIGDAARISDAKEAILAGYLCGLRL